jgi:hypothetical protein
VGTPPGQPDPGVLVENVKSSLSEYNGEAERVKQQLDAGVPIAPDRIGAALDKARSWVQYLAPGGPLSASFPAHLPTPVYVDLLAQVNALQRRAQQWVDYFEPIWQRHSTLESTAAHDEQACLAQIAHANQIVDQRSNSFYMNSGSMTSLQMQGYVNDMNDLLATFDTWRSATNQLLASGHPAPSQALERLVARAQDKLQMFRQSCHNKEVFENFQRQQGQFPPLGPAYGGRPGPGSPEWFDGVTGRRCYWCGWDLAGLPVPVVTCPNCGRFPQPHG